MNTAVPAGLLQIFSKIVDDVYEQTKIKFKHELDKQLIFKKIPKLVEEEINHVRYVKTLWQLDRAVNIDDFYCDSHLKSPSNRNEQSKRYLITKISDFNSNKNILIRGIAGQGKSIFLRYLCIREFELGKRIPIFIELRRIQPNETLFEHITRYFNTLSLEIDPDIFKAMAKSGKFVFFLDGFDEIQDILMDKILNELEYLVCVSSDCQFFVTTRPNTPIEVSPLFDVWALDDLRDDEYKTVIKKLADTPQNAKIIIETIEKQKSSVSGLLCTPLLVTLLLMSYKSFQKIPDQLSDFYESIFSVLLQRHDGTKPAFTRPRLCSLNDSQYRELFDALCYETKVSRKSNFNAQEIFKLLDKAMTITGLEEEATKYLKDIVNVTCLILYEGKEYRFIHRSVQEYYASTFIKNRPDVTAVPFYNSCVDFKVWKYWQAELSFLSDIDKYRYCKYYLMPLCRKLIGVDSDEKLLDRPPHITTQRAKNIIGSVEVAWEHNSLRKGSSPSYFSVGLIPQIMPGEIILEIVNYDYSPIRRKVFSGKLKATNAIDNTEDNSVDDNQPPKPYLSVTLEQVMDEGFLLPELRKFAGIVLNKVYSLWSQSHEYIRQQESVEIIPDFFSNQ